MHLVATILIVCTASAYVTADYNYSELLTVSLRETNGKNIQGEYIIVFREDVTDQIVRYHMDEIATHGRNTARRMLKIIHEYQIGTFRGYSAKMDQRTLYDIRRMKEVSYIERNQVVDALGKIHESENVGYFSPCEAQEGGPWGLGRTTSRNRLIRNGYSYFRKGQGMGVDVYVIDTGIETFHYDFGGRAIWGADFVENPSPETDLNGHGTHVAATIIGDRFGIAKKATAIAVRVLNANGSGTLAGVLKGIEYVAMRHKEGKKSVCNMSLGGGKSDAENAAVTAAMMKGVIFSLAAGNSNRDACDASPASTPGAVTVGASDIVDNFAGFSNWGPCVDIIAPGVNIESAWIRWQTKSISGTSMAAPHVAGVMATVLSRIERKVTPAEMLRFLQNTATRNKIQGIRGDTPNLLVFYQCK